MAHVGYLRGAIKSCMLVYELSQHFSQGAIRTVIEHQSLWTHLVQFELQSCVD